ncbi:hypothetical protein BXZ70DRAFT_910868 [Cristinia sonorae]|uniref:Uncharacterized protein n=1 Tax=Cristinia sonorae TaxID=1940300 RepID=A0A8K0UFJ7_9AGAR|nr:hypothetical protein BXZ70DRAFT_910868 [Cristinia sonorae]
MLAYGFLLSSDRPLADAYGMHGTLCPTFGLKWQKISDAPGPKRRGSGQQWYLRVKYESWSRIAAAYQVRCSGDKNHMAERADEARKQLVRPAIRFIPSDNPCQIFWNPLKIDLLNTKPLLCVELLQSILRWRNFGRTSSREPRTLVIAKLESVRTSIPAKYRRAPTSKSSRAGSPLQLIPIIRKRYVHENPGWFEEAVCGTIPMLQWQASIAMAALHLPSASSKKSHKSSSFAQ